MCLGKEPGFGRELIRVSSSGGRNEGLESQDSSGPTSICKRSTGGECCCWWGNFLCVVCATFGFGCNLRRVLIEGEQQRQQESRLEERRASKEQPEPKSRHKP